MNGSALLWILQHFHPSFLHSRHILAESKDPCTERELPAALYAAAAATAGSQTGTDTFRCGSACERECVCRLQEFHFSDHRLRSCLETTISRQQPPPSALLRDEDDTTTTKTHTLPPLLTPA